MTIIEAAGPRLVFDRVDAGERLRCAFNLSEGPMPLETSGRVLIGTGEAAGVLGAYAALIEAV
jgi:hypothetical protein